MRDYEFDGTEPLYTIGLEILAIDAFHRGESGHSPELDYNYYVLAFALFGAADTDEDGLVRCYDELLRKTSRNLDIALMDAMMFIDMTLDTGPMPELTP